MIPKRQMQLKTTAFEITYLVLNAAHIFVYLYICIILSPVLATINNSGAAAVCHSKVGRNYSSTKLCLHSSLVKYVTSGWYKHTRVLVPLIITYPEETAIWTCDESSDVQQLEIWELPTIEIQRCLYTGGGGSHKVTNGHVTHLRLVCKEGGEGGVTCQLLLSIVNNTWSTSKLRPALSTILRGHGP